MPCVHLAGLTRAPQKPFKGCLTSSAKANQSLTTRANVLPQEEPPVPTQTAPRRGRDLGAGAGAKPCGVEVGSRKQLRQEWAPLLLDFPICMAGPGTPQVTQKQTWPRATKRARPHPGKPHKAGWLLRAGIGLSEAPGNVLVLGGPAPWAWPSFPPPWHCH